LTITLKNTTVHVTGKTQAIEREGDKIQLKFIRQSADISAALTVHFHVVWSNRLSLEDIAEGQGKTDLLAGTIVIGANQTEASMELIPLVDSDATEGLESALLLVDPGDDYTPPRTKLDPTDPNLIVKGWKLSNGASLQVLDKVTLFADGTPGKPDPSGAIDFSDVKQQMLGDCYFLVVLTHLTQYNPAVIQSAIVENAATEDPYDSAL